MSTFTATPGPFVNSTILAAAASSAPDLLVLGSVAVGLGGVSVLAILSSFIAKQFAPDASGNRPSLSQVASNMFTLAKKKAVDIAKDLEADVKEKIEIVKKDPKLLLKAVSNPKEALSFAKASVTKAVKQNLPVSQPPVSQSSVVVAVEDFPGHISDEVVSVDAVGAVTAPPVTAAVVDVPSISGSSLTTIQVNEEDLESVQKMLKLLNKPHTVVSE
jgi:hypothetical protein